MEVVVRPGGSWDVALSVPGDKSLSHRALLLAAMARGESVVRELSPSADVRSMARCLKKLGAKISGEESDRCTVVGWGESGWREPDQILNCGNSGTAMRLLAGVLASRPGFTILTGDRSLRSRPMGRIVAPLEAMGARLGGRDGNRLPPLAICGAQLQGIDYRLPMASAQVKSCLMLAGLAAGGPTRLTEPGHSRDHTERMLASLGVPVTVEGNTVVVEPAPAWQAFEFTVPGDASSAAFLIGATIAADASRIRLTNIGLNPGRIGFFDILERMGARLDVRTTHEEMGEPVGEVTAESSTLRGVEVGPDEVPGAIDELPLLAVMACRARGTTRVRGAKELRFKESDRISTVVAELGRMGARIEEHDDGFSVHGPCRLEGTAVQCYKDHRLEMGLAVAALFARGCTRIKGAGWAGISFPNFWELFPGNSTGWN